MARQAFVVALFLSLTVTVWSQEGWVYPPTEVTASDAESLEEARRSVNLHDYKVALEIYLRLAEENRGTAHGAACLESARSVYFLKGDRAAAESVRQRIITEYSGSRFEVYARYNALQSSPSSGPEDSLLAYSDFLQEFGAPRLEGLCTGETIEQATLQVRSLHPEIRFGIASVYSAAFCIPEDNQQALNIARFGRMAFHSPFFVNIDFGAALEEALENLAGQPIAVEPSRPTISVLAPAPNSTVGSPTEISFKLTSGDYRYELVNLNLLSFRLDGVEQSSNALVLSELSEKMEEGVDLETLTLSLNPSLSPGLHTVEVSAHTGHDQPTKDNSTTATWSFTVAGDTKSADRN